MVSPNRLKLVVHCLKNILKDQKSRSRGSSSTKFILIWKVLWTGAREKGREASIHKPLASDYEGGRGCPKREESSYEFCFPPYLRRELKELGEGQGGTPELSISLNWLKVNFLLLT